MKFAHNAKSIKQHLKENVNLLKNHETVERYIITKGKYLLEYLFTEMIVRKLR